MKGYRLILLLLIAVPILLQWKKDLIPVNEGFGWDGNMYGMYTQFLPEAFEQKAINSHRFQRILVPAGLYYIMDGLKIERTTANVVEAYRWANAFFILLGAFFFFGIASSAGWHWTSTSLGFGALFLSVPVLKMSLYYPLLPDIPTMTFGLMAIYFWYKNWPVALSLSILVGAFTGPTMILYGILLLFPRQPIDLIKNVPRYTLVIVPTIFLGVWIWVWFTFPNVFFDPPSGSQFVQMPLLPIALLIALVWVIGMGKLLVQPNWKVAILNKSILLRLAGLVVLFFLIQWFNKWGAGPEAPPQTLMDYFSLIVAQSVTYPASFLVAHFQYLPGMIILLALALPFILPSLQKLGAGAWILTLGTGFLLMGTETRQLMQMIPWVVVLITITVDREWRWPAWLVGIYLAGLLLASRFWEILGITSIELPYLEEPAQRYFRFHGPWMNSTTWLETLAWLSGSLLLLFLLWKKGLLPRQKSTLSRTPKS